MISPESLAIHASTSWTRNYIQILKESTGEWFSAQYSSYATSRARCVGYLYNAVLNAPEWYDGVESSCFIYASLYENTSQRLLDAISGYTTQTTAKNGTGDISFHLISEDLVEIEIDTEPLFVHHEYTNDITITDDMLQ